MPKRQTKKPGKSTLSRLDGALCLSFVNTGSKKRSAFRDYAGCLLWLESQGALESGEARRFRGLGSQDPEQAGEAFTAALQLRAVLREIFNEVAGRRQVSSIHMDALNVYLVTSVPRRHLVPSTGTRFRWEWVGGREDDLERPLWAVILSAARLLASDDIDRVRRCDGEDCDLLFVARNSGSPRRWCSMNSCGSRVHSYRHYHKKVKPLRRAWNASSPGLARLFHDDPEPSS